MASSSTSNVHQVCSRVTLTYLRGERVRKGRGSLLGVAKGPNGTWCSMERLKNWSLCQLRRLIWGHFGGLRWSSQWKDPQIWTDPLLLLNMVLYTCPYGDNPRQGLHVRGFEWWGCSTGPGSQSRAGNRSGSESFSEGRQSFGSDGFLFGAKKLTLARFSSYQWIENNRTCELCLYLPWKHVTHPSPMQRVLLAFGQSWERGSVRCLIKAVHFLT